MLSTQSTCLSHRSEITVVNQPQSSYANQLVVEPKAYATLQSFELTKNDYQQLSK